MVDLFQNNLVLLLKQLSILIALFDKLNLKDLFELMVLKLEEQLHLNYKYL